MKRRQRAKPQKKEIAADCIKQQGEEIERLKERLDAKCDICIERDKTAAIREFAKRLKEESGLYCSAPNSAGETVLAVSCDDIDAIVKEMTEDES